MMRMSTDTSVHISLEYDLDDVLDPREVESRSGVGAEWLTKYKYIVSGITLQDCITNDVGWYILSERVMNVLFATCRNAHDINAIKFADQTVTQISFLKRYCICGITRTILCVNRERSDARWSKDAPNKADCIYKGNLTQTMIPDDADIFHLAECPTFPVVRSDVAKTLIEMNVTGIKFVEYKVA